MKKFIKSIVVTAVASNLFLAGNALAAEQKIGVVNFQEVMSKIPQTATVMQTLEAEFKDKKAKLTTLETDITYQQEKKKRDSALMTEAQKIELDTKIAGLFQKYKQLGAEFQQAVNIRQKEETNKIVTLIGQAVNKIADKQGYDLVIEQKAIVFVKPEASITELVVEQVSKIK